MCCAAFYFICGNHLHDVQVYIGVPAENIFVDLFRTLDGHDYDGRARLFRDAENTVVEGEQLTGFTPSALRIYSNGHLAALKQVGSLMDRSQGFSGILPINC